jgi:hypothetical protein
MNFTAEVFSHNNKSIRPHFVMIKTFSVIYYFIRIKRIIEVFIIPLIVISFIGVSLVWILSGGIEGSSIMISVSALILALIISPAKFKKWAVNLNLYYQLLLEKTV